MAISIPAQADDTGPDFSQQAGLVENAAANQNGEASQTGQDSGASQAQNPAVTGLAADPELSMFLRKLGEQQALTYTIDKRNQMLEAGAKAVSDWEPSAIGVNALAAPKALNASLASLKESLLQDAPSDLARQEAARDLDGHIDSFMERGGMIARDGFKNYVLQTNNDWLTKLLSIAAGSGGDPATQQWVLDTGKASWIALGQDGLVLTPEQAAQGAASFEKDAAKAYLLGQMTNPALQNKAIAEYQAGHFDEILSPDDIVRFDEKVAAIKRQQLADADRAQNQAGHRLAAARNQAALGIQEAMEKDAKTLSPLVLALKHSRDTLAERERQGDITIHQARILDNLRQGIMDPDDQDRTREAARRVSDGSMTLKQFDADYAGRIEPRTEASLRAILTNPALENPEAKRAEERIAALVAAPLDNLRRADLLVAKVRNQTLVNLAVGMFRDLVTNQGKSVAEAQSQAVAKVSPLFDDSLSPPASLTPLGIVSYPDKLSDIDFDGARRKIVYLAASGRISRKQKDDIWADLRSFLNDVSRRDQMKGQVRQ